MNAYRTIVVTYRTPPHSVPDKEELWVNLAALDQQRQRVLATLRGQYWGFDRMHDTQTRFPHPLPPPRGVTDAVGARIQVNFPALLRAPPRVSGFPVQKWQYRHHFLGAFSGTNRISHSACETCRWCGRRSICSCSDCRPLLSITAKGARTLFRIIPAGLCET